MIGEDGKNGRREIIKILAKTIIFSPPLLQNGFQGISFSAFNLRKVTIAA